MSIEKNLFDEILEFEQDSDLKLLTHEARIAYDIKLNPGQPIKCYFTRSGVSYRAFYNIFNKLLKSGFLDIKEDDVDRRIRRVY